MQNNTSIGAIECKSISKGIEVANELSKEVSVEVIYFKTICPGRFLVIVAGDEGEIKASISYGETICGDFLLGSFMINAVSPEIIAGLKQQYRKEPIDALGVLETKTVCSGLQALDRALKAGDVCLVKLKMAQTISGKIVAVISGSISSIKYGLADAEAEIGDQMIYTSAIPAPNLDILEFLNHI